MRCDQCGAENPKRSKFCRKCGASSGVQARCPRCDYDNPGDSIFCVECGERLKGNPKAAKGTQRKCRSCSHFNELDALYCVSCGEEIVKATQNQPRRTSAGPSYGTIVLVIGMVLLLGLFVKLGATFLKKRDPSQLSSPSTATTASMIKVNEAQVSAVAKNFRCGCGDCGELLQETLDTCTCDMPKGAVEAKNFIRLKLSEGLTVDQVIEKVEEKYGHRVGKT